MGGVLAIRVCSIVVYGRCFIDQGVFYCSIWEVFYCSIWEVF